MLNGKQYEAVVFLFCLVLRLRQGKIKIASNVLLCAFD